MNISSDGRRALRRAGVARHLLEFCSVTAAEWDVRRSRGHGRISSSGSPGKPGSRYGGGIKGEEEEEEMKNKGGGSCSAEESVSKWRGGGGGEGD